MIFAPTFASLSNLRGVEIDTPADGEALVYDSADSKWKNQSLSDSLDATLVAFAGISTAANKLPYLAGEDTFSTTDFTAFARTILDDTDAAAVRTTLGLVIGTNVQAFHANLTAVSGLTISTDTLPYGNGSGTLATTALTSFGRSLLDDADAATARTTIGMSANGSSLVSAADYSAMRTLLGLVIGTNVASQAALDAITSGYARRRSVIARVDNTAAPPTEVTGNRYLLDATGASHANWDGAAANSIATFNGTVWTSETPEEGWITYNDGTNTDWLYVDDGSPAWQERTAGGATDLDSLSDVTITTATTGNLLRYNGSAWVNASLSTCGIQPLDATLTALAGVSTSGDTIIYATDSDAFSTTTLSSFARTLIDDADASTARGTLGVVIGTNVQAYHANLAAFAGLTIAADKLPYGNGSGTLALADLTSFARTLLDDANAGAFRTTLGIGTSDSVTFGDLAATNITCNTNGVILAKRIYAAINSLTDGATVTVNWADRNTHKVTLGGNRAIAFSNVKEGQKIAIGILQDGTGSRTITTWPDTIRWAGGSAPTLTTTASKRDWIGLICTDETGGSEKYDGFVLSMNH